MVGVFAFSPQPGTPAAALEGQVPEHVKQERIVEVVSLQNQISRVRIENLIGRELEVLVEDRGAAGTAVGRSQYDMGEVDRIIHLRKCATPPGRFTTARITSCLSSYEMEGAEVST
jgi:tRNA A37 methylthiotransferase MiaB